MRERKDGQKTEVHREKYFSLKGMGENLMIKERHLCSADI